MCCTVLPLFLHLWAFKSHKNAKPFRNKGFPHYDTMLLLMPSKAKGTYVFRAGQDGASQVAEESTDDEDEEDELLDDGDDGKQSEEDKDGEDDEDEEDDGDDDETSFLVRTCLYVLYMLPQLAYRILPLPLSPPSASLQPQARGVSRSLVSLKVRRQSTRCRSNSETSTTSCGIWYLSRRVNQCSPPCPPPHSAGGPLLSAHRSWRLIYRTMNLSG